MSDCRISVWSDPYCQKNKARNSGTAFPAATRQSRYSHTAENHKTGRRETPVPIIPSSFGEVLTWLDAQLEPARTTTKTLDADGDSSVCLNFLDQKCTWTIFKEDRAMAKLDARLGTED
ncbi:hypothetical protein MCOR25_001601 [Pyricularia grisea]|nr:hypothetical protein MCOR25_001601 [Pyricularia grisea]